VYLYDYGVKEIATNSISSLHYATFQQVVMILLHDAFFNPAEEQQDIKKNIIEKF